MVNVDRVRAALDVVLVTCDINAEVDSKLQAIRAMLDEPAEAEERASLDKALAQIDAWESPAVEGDEV